MSIQYEELDSERYWSFPKNYTNKQKETKQMIVSGRYLCSEKKDGHYMRLIKKDDGTIIFQGRTRGVDGTYANKAEFVPQLQEFFDLLPNNTCLLGEAYLPNKRGSRNITTILGCLKDKAIKRQEKEEDKLHYYIFDVWEYNGEDCLNKMIEERVSILNKIPNAPYIEKANYLEGEEAWNNLGEILSNGGEGMVITKKGNKPEPGKRTSRKTLKVKMEIEQTIDAFIDGNYKEPTRNYTGIELEKWNLWLNLKTGKKYNESMFDDYIAGAAIIPVTRAYYYGWASAISISVLKDGKPQHIGWISGISDELKEGIIKEPEKWIHKVVEISAMEIEKINEHYSLRHGKIVNFRDDKSWQDCDFSQIEN